jgi:cytochrome c553
MSLQSTFIARAAAALATGCIATASLAQAGAPAADLKRGQEVATQVCAACHAADGNSTISANPKIAGMDQAYLLKQLNDFARPANDKSARVNGIMTGILGAISVADRVHVSAFYAGQSFKPGAARNKELLEAGQRLYRAGVPSKGLPACSGCHSPNGAGIPIQYPRLGGQHAEYTETQLKAFRDGTRRNNEAMAQIAARLSDAEIKALADYVAGLR